MKQKVDKILKRSKRNRKVPLSSGTTLRGLILYNFGWTEKLFEEIMSKIFPNFMGSINRSKKF